MDNGIVFNKPYLEVITGPMFSGKSQELARKLINLDYYNKHDMGTPVNYIVLRPDTDTRPDSVRNIPYKNSYIINSKTPELVDKYKTLDLSVYDIIAFDEAQFLSEEYIELVKNLLDSGKHVIIVGLDKNFRKDPFSEFMKWALCAADDVIKLTAICAECGAPSTLAELINADLDEDSDTSVVIETENTKFVPKCRSCYRYNTKSVSKKKLII